MSLRDLGVFAPLEPTHPLVVDAKRCHYCDLPLTTGVRVDGVHCVGHGEGTLDLCVWEFS